MQECFLDHLCNCGNFDAPHFAAKFMDYYEKNWQESKIYRVDMMVEWLKEEPIRVHEAVNLLFQILDYVEIMEHGSSIPGWLTADGRSWVEAKLKEGPDSDH